MISFAWRRNRKERKRDGKTCVANGRRVAPAIIEKMVLQTKAMTPVTTGEEERSEKKEGECGSVSVNLSNKGSIRFAGDPIGIVSERGCRLEMRSRLTFMMSPNFHGRGYRPASKPKCKNVRRGGANLKKKKRVLVSA